MPVGIPVTGDAAERLRHQWARALTDRPALTTIVVSHLDADDEVAPRLRHHHPRHDGRPRRDRGTTDQPPRRRGRRRRRARARGDRAVRLGQDDGHRPPGHATRLPLRRDRVARRVAARARPPEAAVGHLRPRPPAGQAVRLARRGRAAAPPGRVAPPPHRAAAPRRGRLRAGAAGTGVRHRGDGRADVVARAARAPAPPPGRAHRRLRWGVGPALPRDRGAPRRAGRPARRRRPDPWSPAPTTPAVAPWPKPHRARGGAHRGSTRWSTTTSSC